MVAKNDCMIPQCGPMPDLGAAKRIVGAKQLKKAILAGTARQVYLAQDADPAVTEPLQALCQAHKVPVSYVSTMAELGRACHIEVGAAAAAVIR